MGALRAQPSAVVGLWHTKIPSQIMCQPKKIEKSKKIFFFKKKSKIREMPIRDKKKVFKIEIFFAKNLPLVVLNNIY